MDKTVEELMRPRYKVIADYPGSDFKIGDILKKENDFYGFEIVPGRIRYYSNHMIESYPHLFRKLSWWQERKEEELPNYLRHRNGTIYKVFKYHMEFGCVDLSEDDKFPTSFAYLTPATESEYNDFIKSKELK